MQSPDDGTVRLSDLKARMRKLAAAMYHLIKRQGMAGRCLSNSRQNKADDQFLDQNCYCAFICGLNLQTLHVLGYQNALLIVFMHYYC